MKTVAKGLLFTALLFLSVSTAFADKGFRVNGAIWAHNDLYDTVITDTAFHLPPVQTTDTLYNFSMSGLGGQRAVSESAPGDRNFNGGRWAVKLAIFTELGKSVHDPDGDGIVNFELTNAEAVLDHLALGHLEIIDTAIYFECPLLPSR